MIERHTPLMSAEFSNLEYSFELGKFREETSSVRRHLLNFAKRSSDCELARADLKVGVQDLYAETKRLESAFGRNFNKSTAAVLGEMNAAAHEMNATLQHCAEGRALAGDSFDYLKERCKELADRIDELLHEFTSDRELFVGGSPTKRQST